MRQNNKLNRFSKFAVVISTALSAAVIIGVSFSSAAGDLLALGKNDGEAAEITINEINELAGALKDHDIIEHPLFFSAYVAFCELGGKNTEVRNHTATVSSDMDYANLLSAFTSPPPVRTVTITFPDGATTDEIIDIFVKNGIGTREAFASAINSYPFEYDFIPLLDAKMSGDRLYRLDGYLYPDTYDFYTGRAETYYIYKMLDRFCSVIAEIGLEKITDDDVIVASLVQSSSEKIPHYEYISSAIRNRLNDPETYPYLCVPASSAYALRRGGVYVGLPTDEIKSLPSPYNTYENEGLPPGAICNPSKNALIAALYPASSQYKYFLTLGNGDVIFAKTEREHNSNCNNFIP